VIATARPPRAPRARLSATAALLVALVACTPTYESAVAEHGPAIDALLAQAAAVAEHAAHAPLLTAPQPIAPDPPLFKGVLDGSRTNWELVYLDDLRALPDHAAMQPWSVTATQLHRCASLLHNRREPHTPGLPAPTTRLCDDRLGVLLAACRNLRYLGVIRIHELVEPHAPECPPDTHCGYHGGSVRGDLLFYRLADGALLGGAPFTAESNSSMVDNAAIQTNLWQDLRWRADAEINTIVRTHASVQDFY
jgi:hypothetical protein